MTLDPHPGSAGLATRSALDLAGDLQSGRLTSVDVVQSLLDRIEAVDGPGDIRLRAVMAVADDAIEIAASLDAERAEGHVRGALHGVPVLIKDSIEAVGLPGTAGSLALDDRPVTGDAPLVTRMREAGLVVLGSTNLSEWANIRSPHSASGWSAYGGLTGNPWALDRSAGGSSSGSGAAIAAGFAPLAIGTETDGSITCPSSLNGCVGLKPTVGLVSTAGVVPISSSQDSPGPMARSVADVAALLDVLTGGDHSASIGSVVLSDIRLGVAEEWRSGHPRTDAVFDDAVELLRTRGVWTSESTVTQVGAAMADELTVMLAELKDDLDAYLAARPGDGVRSLADVVDYNREHRAIELADFGQEFLEQALEIGGRANADYAPARARCLEWAVDQCLDPAFASADAPDVLVAPAYPPAWKSDLTTGDHFIGGFASAAPSIAGWPVLCLPMGLVDRLPVGMVLIGRPHTEARLLAIGHAIERALDLRADPAFAPQWRTPSRG